MLFGIMSLNSEKEYVILHENDDEEINTEYEFKD